MDCITTAELIPVVWRLGTGRACPAADRRAALSRVRAAHGGLAAAWFSSPIAERLAGMLDDHCHVVRAGTAIALGHAAPGVLLDELAAFASEGEDLGAYAAGIDQAVSTAWEYFAGPRPQLTAPALKHARAMTDENEYDRFVRLLPPMLNASQARVFERLDALAAGGAA